MKLGRIYGVVKGYDRVALLGFNFDDYYKDVNIIDIYIESGEDDDEDELLATITFVTVAGRQGAVDYGNGRNNPAYEVYTCDENLCSLLDTIENDSDVSSEDELIFNDNVTYICNIDIAPEKKNEYDRLRTAIFYNWSDFVFALTKFKPDAVILEHEIGTYNLHYTEEDDVSVLNPLFEKTQDEWDFYINNGFKQVGNTAYLIKRYDNKC